MGLRVKPASGSRAESCWGMNPRKSCNRFPNNYNSEFGLKQHLICGTKLAYVHFHFLSPSFNSQLTSLYCNFSYGSKNGPAKYFWDTKSGGGLFYILAPHF